MTEFFLVPKNPHDNDIDQLTDLPKRLAFEQYLRQAVDSECEHALCQIDIDSFVVVNDVYGHESGNELLIAITKLIQNHINSKDKLTRIGNDEYGLILNRCSLDRALTVANNIRESIKQLKMNVGASVYSVTVSIGVAMLNGRSNDLNTSVKNVEVACKAAKQTGDKVQLYQGDDHFILSYHQDMKGVDKIKSALDDDRFQLFAQEIFPLTASEVINKPIIFELLLRMIDTNGSIIFPNDFLPIAARHNLASRIDLLVINKVIGYLQRNLSLANKCSMIMINLSGDSLGNEKILDYLNTHLVNPGFSTETLCFEITETEAIKNVANAINFINQIRTKFGCKFAIDDFGSGFSSFKYIKELPVDIVKIDGSFVKDINNDPISQIMIKAVSDIAKVTHKKVIAEWVENKEVLDKVQEMGVDYGQGYFLGYPILLEDYMQKF